MPFHLDDVNLEEAVEPYRSVLIGLAIAVGEKAVTPAICIKMIHAHLVPLLPETQRSLITIQGQPSWDRIESLHSRLIFAGHQSQDQHLMAIGMMIGMFVRHTARPARETSFPPFIEIVSFNRMCNYLGVPIAKPFVYNGGSASDLYHFCKYCWLPVRRKDVCNVHTTRLVSEEERNHLPICGSLTFKQAQRLKEAFDQQVLAVVTKEEWEFHQSSFDMPALLPPSGLLSWLEQHRPYLASLVQRELTESPANVLRSLAAVMYGRSLGILVNEAIGGAVHLWTPITARAEGWLNAWNNRPRRGGARRRGIKLLETVD